TCVFLWWQTGELDPATVAKIKTADAVYVSAASAWEVSIKCASGKLSVPEPVSTAARAAGFTELAISMAHAERAGNLPMHHRDPFDRLVVAQAMTHGLTVVTADSKLAAYAVSCDVVPRPSRPT